MVATGSRGVSVQVLMAAGKYAAWTTVARGPYIFVTHYHFNNDNVFVKTCTSSRSTLTAALATAAVNKIQMNSLHWAAASTQVTQGGSYNRVVEPAHSKELTAPLRKVTVSVGWTHRDQLHTTRGYS